MTDHKLIAWAGDGYPPELQRILDRQPPMWADISVARGWWPLLARLEVTLADLDPDYTVSQVKQKLGSLSFYASTTLTGDEEGKFFRIIRAAELEASGTCEECARPGVLRSGRGGFYRTMCEEHAAGFPFVADAARTAVRPGPTSPPPDTASDKLTPPEVDAAIAGGVPERVFTEAGHREAAGHKAASTEEAASEVDTWFTAREVGQILGIEWHFVALLGGAGDLATAVSTDRGLVYAPWQFAPDHRPLPGIREVLAAMPAEYRPLDINTVMTTPNEALGDRAPCEVLLTAGGVDEVVAWARDLGLS